jgi:2-haloacid dehalogenase
MTFDPDRVTTVTFDSYSTLLDVDSTEVALEDIPIDTQDIAQLWRRKSLDYARMCNLLDMYQPFYELNRLALEYALKYYEIDLTVEERDEILSVYHELRVFDDVRPGMRRLADAGYDLWVISNGDPEMLDSLVEVANISDLIEDTISADEIGRYKPDPDLYRHAAGRAEKSLEEIAHVTSGWVDVMGATNAGMQSVWVNRKGEPWETLGGDPDLIVEAFDELIDVLV